MTILRKCDSSRRLRCRSSQRRLTSPRLAFQKVEKDAANCETKPNARPRRHCSCNDSCHTRPCPPLASGHPPRRGYCSRRPQ